MKMTIRMEMSMQCTAVMLNWDRPENVTRIVESWERSPFVKRGIVFSNKSDLPDLAPIAVGVRSSEDLGLSTRFLAGLMSDDDVLLIQDDDIILPDQTLEVLLRAREKDPEVLHGIIGRRPKQDGSYARILYRVEADVEVVLTRALVCTKSHCLDFFMHQDEFRLIDQGVPRGNGEDIVFSFIAMARSKRLNRIHNLSWTELPDRSSISSRPGHWSHRTRVLRYCTDWLSKKEVASA